ncbi:MAG TPA: gamma carbonic anhydrase family protein [Spirochaetota bacterium]|nr:gamma carbonic anhydrase family protein [Spirochaetota bacterium]HPS86172.1 gamma carbonic anhydrase family protein [Spirochaetota bacterium]
MSLYEIGGKRPVIDPSSWVAPSADLIGNVIIGKNCYIGWGAVLRGDYGTIIIEDGTAVEENVTIHSRPGNLTKIGKDVTIGHNAMIHNTTIGDNAVIGMNSTITDYSDVGEWSIVAEHSLIKRNQSVPAGKIYAGVPAVEKGDVQEKHKTEWSAAKKIYQNLAMRYRTEMIKLD